MSEEAKQAWETVDGCINEIEWYATRKIDLAKPAYRDPKPWSVLLAEDIKALREAIERARRLS